MLKIGDTAAVLLPLGGYGACQVSGIDADGWVTVCVLDWRSDAIPTLDDLSSAGPLLRDHHSWSAEPEALRIDGSDVPPPDFVWLGQLPIHPDLPREVDSLGGWEGLPLQIAHQRRWDLQVPAEAKAAYKNSARGPVVVDLGDAPQTMDATTSRLDLPAHLAEVRWSGLDALPRLIALGWSGADRGLSEAVAGRPMIQSLIWDDPPAVVDLSTTHLTELVIRGTGLRHLRLPPGLMGLRLTAEPPEVVEAAEEGRWIQLTMTSPAPVPSGLRGIRDLDLRVTDDLSMAALGALTDLESLQIWWSRPYGRLLDAAGPVRLQRLHTLRLTDAYGVDASSLPLPAPSLRRLDLAGIRRSQVRPIKARYKGSPVCVTIRGAKSDTWLAANVDNPLRDWADDDGRAGAAACKAYASALRAIERLPAGDPATAAGARPILQGLVEKLNAIDKRHEVIDTVRREEAADAFFELARRAGVPDSETAAWFDEWRDF
ncbi:hypothetical protein [Streptosporangium roseum]|uniref:hypothetical protein n=1 Tax=Streptosporangium roseum TaxID=2001 RepID=UPI00331C04E8